jgi:hypothetical protein
LPSFAFYQVLTFETVPYYSAGSCSFSIRVFARR